MFYCQKCQEASGRPQTLALVSDKCGLCGEVAICYDDSQATEIVTGIELITKKMKSERPTLREYLRSRAAGNAKSSTEWKTEGAIEQAAFRNGMSQAYRDVERMLERGGFRPSNSPVTENPQEDEFYEKAESQINR